MANVTVVVETLRDVLAPAGTVAGLFRFSIYDRQGNKLAEQDVAEATAVFADVPVGLYSMLAGRLDQNGVLIGGTTGVDFEVVAQDVLVAIPATIAVSVV